MTSIFMQFMTEKQPFRRVVRALIRKAGLGSPEFRFRIGALYRNNYAFLVYNAAQLADRLGHKKVSVAEFGVAGGAGLLAMEWHAEWVEKVFPNVKIEIYGFDTGEGLPPPVDYRDLAYIYGGGFYRMDVPALKARLKRAKLVLGDIADTSKTFFSVYDPAPIGAVSHDMDYHSSTMNGFKLFDAEDSRLLPRIYIYMDDSVADDIAAYGDHTGQRLAIHDFNDQHADKKISPAYHLMARLGYQWWHYQTWILHCLKHRDYDTLIVPTDQHIHIDGNAFLGPNSKGTGSTP